MREIRTPGSARGAPGHRRPYLNLQEKMISKANSRTTTIGDVRFRYKVSSRPRSKGVYELNVTIQSEDHNGSKLLVTGIFQHDCHVSPPKCDGDYIYLPTILRIDIDGFIREAMAKGWDYKKQDEDFRLGASNEMFRLFGYWENKPKEWFHGRNYGSKKNRTGEQVADGNPR